MSAYISSLGPQIERFLAHKRGLGFIYYREERFLAEFDRVAADLDEGQNHPLAERRPRRRRLHDDKAGDGHRRGRK